MSIRTLIVAGAAAAALVGGGGAAMASTSGGTPYPTPTPKTSTPPPVIRHHHPRLHCFESVLVEVDVNGHQVPLAPLGFGARQDHPKADTIVVVQEVRVCEQGRHVWADDTSPPFAFQVGDHGQLPGNLPAPVQGALTS